MRASTFPILAAIGWFTAAASQEASLHEVLVEATRYTSGVSVAGKTPVSAREIPASVSVLTEQRLEEQNLNTLGQALAQVTGVTVVPNDGLQSQYRSRGYALSVMNDGVPAYTAFSGYQQYDAAIYERIEVLRGPNGLLTGVADPAGAVNLVTKRGLEALALDVTASYASWHDKRVTVDGGGPVIDNGSIRGRAVGVFEDSAHFSGGMKTQRALGYARVDWDVTSSTTFSASAAAQHDRRKGGYHGLPAYEDGPLLDLPRSTHVTPEWNRSSWDTRDVTAMLRQHMGEHWSFTVRGWLREQNQYFFDAYPLDGVRAADTTLPFGRRRFDYEFSRAALDAFVSGEVSLFGRRHALIVGYNYDRFDQDFVGVSRTANSDAIRVPLGQSSQVQPLDFPYDQGGETERSQSGTYAQVRASLAEALTLVAGARVSDFEGRTRNSAPSVPTQWRSLDRQTNEVTPMAGILYDATRWLSLYASYAETFVPQSTSLRADGEPLDPRIGRQYEVGAKGEWFGGALQGSAAVYDLRDHGRALADRAHPGFYLNAGEVESKGWEAELVGTPWRNYEIQVGYSRLDASFLAGTPAQVGQRFSIQEPKHSWRVWMIRRLTAQADSGWTVGAGFTAQSGIEDLPRAQGSYAIANAMVAYRFSDSLSLALNANNIFDEVHYTRIGGTNTYNTYGAPRNFALTVRASY